MNKVIMAQLNYTIGDFSGNVAKIKQCIKDHGDADIIVFSELAISGYYPFDLLDRSEFVDKHEQALDQVIQYSEGFDCYVLIGAIAKNTRGQGKNIFNSAFLIYRGTVIFNYYKHLLPVYNIYDEARHFEPGCLSPVFSIKGKKYAAFICEDIWYHQQSYSGIDPVAQIRQNELEAVFVLNASPSNIGKSQQRWQLVQDLAENVQVPVYYVNQVGGNDEIVFDGNSFAVDRHGQLLAQAKSFEEEVIAVTQQTTCQKAYKAYDCYEAFLFEQLKLGLSDYIRKCGFQGIVVGCSGGIDSAVVIAVAAYALGADNVFAITMPSVYSSSGSVIDSQKLCENLGVKLYTRAIGSAYESSCQDFESAFGKQPSKLTRENIQARIRGRIVMEYSNNENVLAVATGNKSEMSVGYATLYGDMNGAICLLGDLYKQDVYALAKYINQQYGQKIPDEIIDKEPSAELSADQKDSDSLPSYDVLDPILKLYIEEDMLDTQERACLKAKLEGVSQHEIQRIHRMVDFAEFKRKQAPPIIRVQRRSFGLGRQLPVAQRFTHHR